MRPPCAPGALEGTRVLAEVLRGGSSLVCHPDRPTLAPPHTVGPGRGRIAELRYELQVLVRWILCGCLCSRVVWTRDIGFFASPLFLARVLALQLLLHILRTRGKKKKSSLHQSRFCWYMSSCTLFISVQAGLSLTLCLASSSDIVK